MKYFIGLLTIVPALQAMEEHNKALQENLDHATGLCVNTEDDYGPPKVDAARRKEILECKAQLYSQMQTQTDNIKRALEELKILNAREHALNALLEDRNQVETPKT